MPDLTDSLPNGLTKRDLKMVGVSFGSQYIVTVHQTKEGLWTVSLKFEGQDEPHTIETARGDMKVWRNVVSAITFVQENCKLASDVFVEVSGWKLARAQQ
jgi:hypothetical protein